eukprot:3300374-Alexandrium_andersonii.AAC.1
MSGSVSGSSSTCQSLGMAGSGRSAARKDGASWARPAWLSTTSASTNCSPMKRSWAWDRPTRGAGFGESDTTAGPG